MERIRLNRQEKEVLRLVTAGMTVPTSYPLHVYISSADSLERKGLVKVAWTEGHTVESIRLSDFGKTYMVQNPLLRNPANWTAIATIVSIVGVTIAVIALFVACA